MSRSVRKVAWSAAAFIAVLALLVLSARVLPKEPLAARIPSSTAVFDVKGKLLRLTLATDQQYRLWTPLDDVAPEFIDALLLHEDRYFYFHPGFNPAALIRATFSSYSGGARVGGSTVTMQLARLMYRLNTRTVGGKLKQIACAIQLELRYSKRELLEAHINLMPYGGNLQGVGAASLVYFKKPAARLDLAEALALVVIPQSPERRKPLRQRHGVSKAAPEVAEYRAEEPPALRAARLRLFERWREQYPNAKLHATFVSLPLQYSTLAELPFIAPHFTQQLLDASPSSPESIDRLCDSTARCRSHRSKIHSTLDIALQRLTERVLQNYVRERRSVGISNAAVLLIDYRDSSVRAMVGSADFFDATIKGQVNGTLAKRSPGSALKPFIYALAIDQGVIHPLTVLKDAPTSFGSFSPENFDGRFVGPLTATEALTRSRNVPAVALSAQLTRPGFYQFLKSAGITQMASEGHYGLALALGGGEVTMEETGMLYSMLANRGRLSTLRYRVEDTLDPGPQLLSEEASFMTLEMLKSAPRPEDAFARNRSRLGVAWKTGTSWGFRDAWTAGVFGPYVLVVWTGNFDGRGNPALVGVQAAAPLFFRLTDALAAHDPQLFEPAFRQPARLARVEVCSVSGDLPNSECPQTSTTWYIPGVSPMRISDVHRRVWIDTRTGQQACAPRDPKLTRSEVYEFWPTELLQLFAQAGMPRRRPPPSAQCHRDSPSGTPPRITSPLTASTYTVRARRVGEEAIPLAANADSEVRKLHWFVDDSYIGTGAPGVAVGWNPARSGRHIVRAVDDRGRADSRELHIAFVQ